MSRKLTTDTGQEKGWSKVQMASGSGLGDSAKSITRHKNDTRLNACDPIYNMLTDTGCQKS